MMISIQELNSHARKIGLVHEMMLAPLSRKTGLPQTAISILVFLANNPELATARDVCKLRGFKRAIVSTHVERLVSDGLLQRKEYPGDRRKDILVCTEKAMPIIEEARVKHVELAMSLLNGLSDDDLASMAHCFDVMNRNLDTMIKCNGRKGDNADDKDT